MDLQDYSGEFNPNLKLEDFSKDALVRLAGVIAKDFIGQDGMWFSLVKAKYGLEEGKKLTEEMWISPEFSATKAEMRRVVSAFNIKGNDIATVFKYLQVSPQIGPYFFDVKFDLKNARYGVLTINRCPSLGYYERHGDESGAKWVCAKVDAAWFPMVAACFNTSIKVRPLTELPRKNKEGIACQWEFKLVEE